MITRILTTAVAALTFHGVAMGQLAIDWHTIDGGGGMFSTGGGLEIGGTLGQFDAGPAAGPMTGGGLELVGGFWTVANIGAAPCDGFSPCDANCDGSVNLFDIDPFVAALLPGPILCSPCAADANADGSVNLFDITPFVVCLTG